MTDTATVADAGAEGAFIEPVAMEDDPDELFAGDRGVLDPEVRRVLVHVLQRRFLLADRNREEWNVLLDNQQMIESRLNDMFVRLVVDHDRGVAFKQQVRSDLLEVPIRLRDSPYSRAETLVLVHLRTVYQRETAAGEPSARVDVEDVEQTVLSYFAEADGDTARRQRAIRKAMERLARDGIVEEETAGRFRISPLVEIVLSAEKLRELRDWLRDQAAGAGGEAGDPGGRGIAFALDPDDDEVDADNDNDTDTGDEVDSGDQDPDDQDPDAMKETLR